MSGKLITRRRLLGLGAASASSLVLAGCDQFDWFNQGTTRAQREAAHNQELDNVDRQIDDMFRLKSKYCR